MNVAAGLTDHADPRDTFATFLPTLTRGSSPLARTRLAFTALVRGNRFGEGTVALLSVGAEPYRTMR